MTQAQLLGIINFVIALGLFISMALNAVLAHNLHKLAEQLLALVKSMPSVSLTLVEAPAEPKPEETVQ